MCATPVCSHRTCRAEHRVQIPNCAVNMEQGALVLDRAAGKGQQRHLCGIYSRDGAALGWALKSPSANRSDCRKKGSIDRRRSSSADTHDRATYGSVGTIVILQPSPDVSVIGSVSRLTFEQGLQEVQVRNKTLDAKEMTQ